MAGNQTKHGLFGKTLKIIMIIIFFVIGAYLITLGAVYRGKKWDIGTYDGENYNIKWLSILNIVLGCILLTSPFFLNHKRTGFNKVVQILMVIVFVLIGGALIATNAIVLAKKYYEAGQKWFPILNLVLGCLLFTAPAMLKKD